MAAADDDEGDIWLSVIGKSLAYLCLSQAATSDPTKYRDVLAKVDFLEGLGLPTRDAAVAAGSSVASVSELRRQRRNKKSSGKKSKAAGRKR